MKRCCWKMGRKCVLPVMFILLLLCSYSSSGEERYVITTRDGATIVAIDYRFTDEYVEFTTENGLPGYIKREEFAAISNMVGVPPGETEQAREKVSREERSRKIILLAAVLLAVLFAILLVYLSGKRKKEGSGEADIYYGRKDKEPTTQGHLSFEYKGFMGRVSRWTIEVRDAYEEEGVLHVEGICTTTGKRKTFRADRIVGPVTDMSRDHHAPLDHFFTDAKEGG